MNSISAAHKTLPLPSYVRVTNLANRRSIVVRVNDRGPYAADRVIDLSTKTAQLLGFYGHGLAKVKVEYVGRAPLAGSDDRKLMATLREGTPAQAPYPPGRLQQAVRGRRISMPGRWAKSRTTGCRRRPSGLIAWAQTQASKRTRFPSEIAVGPAMRAPTTELCGRRPRPAGRQPRLGCG